MDKRACGGQQVRHRVEVNAAQELCQRPDCFCAGQQLSPSFRTQMQAHLYPSFLQPSARCYNGVNIGTKLWPCLCIRHVHWQNQLYTRQPVPLQQGVWAQLQFAQICCLGAFNSKMRTNPGRNTHQLYDHQKQPCSLAQGHDFAESQHKGCQRISSLASVDS